MHGSVQSSSPAARPAMPPGGSLLLALRFALRMLRGGVKGFGVFLACIALGVAAIAGVNGLAASLTEGLAREGRAILGADIAFTLIHRQATDAERGFLEGLGQVSAIATLRGMARTEDNASQNLVEIKAVDAAYPLAAKITLENDQPLRQALEQQDGLHGAVVAPLLLDRLGIEAGAVLHVGDIRLRVSGVIASESDQLSSGIGFGPRLLISRAALDASGLVQPGSLVRWHYRLRLDDPGPEAMAAIIARSESAFPDAGWEIRTRANAAPRLAQNIERFTQLLTLVGLTALIVGGVGVANAVQAFVKRNREIAATLRCMGATGRFIFQVFLIQISALALLGIALGLGLGALLPLLAGNLLAGQLPIPLDVGLDPGGLMLAAAYGALSALAFSLWPLGKTRRIAPSELFRERLSSLPGRPDLFSILATLAAISALLGLALIAAESKLIALIFAGAALGAIVLLRLVGWGVMRLAASLPRRRATVLRLALANLHRPGALTPTVILSLGLGLTLLVALTLIDGTMRQQLATTLPERAPSFFFLDIQNSDADAFTALIQQQAPEGTLERVPMLRGRLSALNGVPTTEITAPPEAAWVLTGDRGITYAATPPDAAGIVEGQWWAADHSGDNLVSFDAKLAHALGLSLGDSLTVNVLGREITATIANLRDVEWRSLGINFVMVFSPNTFAGAPHSILATLSLPDSAGPDAEKAVIRAVTTRFPAVTAIRVKDALDTINDLVGKLALATRIAASVTLIASILVLAGALAAGHRERIYDAVILKTLGATRLRLLAAYSLEYALLGLAAALFSLLAGNLIAWVVLEKVMSVGYAFLPGTALMALLLSLVLTIGFGLMGTARVLGKKPAPILRNP